MQLSDLGQQKPESARGETERAEKFMPLTEASTLLYRVDMSVPIAGGVIPLEPDGLQGSQGLSDVPFIWASNWGRAAAVAARARVRKLVFGDIFEKFLFLIFWYAM